MSIATSAAEGLVEAFGVQNIQVAGFVAEGPKGARIPQVVLAMVGVTPMVDVGAKTYITYLSVDVAKQLGGAFAEAADEAIAEAGADAPTKMPEGLVSARPGDVAKVAEQAQAIAGLRE